MADRPTSNPQWATIPTEALSPPSAGLRAAGYVAGDVLPSSELNSIFQVFGEHAQWYLEGVRQPALMTGSPSVTVVAAAKTFTRSTGSWLTDGFHDGMLVTFGSFVNAGNNTTQVIDGEPTATVLTLTSSSGLVDETDATVSCVSHFYIRERITTSQPMECQQSLLVGSSLEVGGQVLFNDQLEVLGTSEFSDDVDVQADLLVAGDVTLSADLFHGTYHLLLSTASGTFHANLAPQPDGEVLASGSATTYVQIPLNAGDSLDDVTIRVAGNSTTVISAQLRISDGAGVSSSISGAAATATPSATWTDLALTVTPHVMTGNETAYLTLTCDAAAAEFGQIDVSWSRQP